MARKIRFPLKMKNGAEVRTLEEFKENFDLESVLGYFTDGKLATWLEDRYYDVEAQKVSELDANSSDLKSQLCAILGVKYAEEQADDIDIDVINRRNEKKNILSQLTDNTEALNNIDSVALNQDDLLDCYDLGLSTIYLVGDTVYSIPVSVTNVTYIGLCGAKVEIRATGNVDFNEKNLVFKDISFVGNITPKIEKNPEQKTSISSSGPNNSLECDGTNFKELLELAKNGNAEAQYEIGKFLYENDDHDLAVYWLMKAINSKHIKAMYYLAANSQYNRKYIIPAAESGYAPAQYKLGKWYNLGMDCFNRNQTESYKWLKKAAENGYVLAQRYLGELLNSSGMFNFKMKNTDEAILWLTKAAEQCDPIACRDLGKIYYNTKNDKKKAIEWLKIAAENGASRAVRYLKEIEDGRAFI